MSAVQLGTPITRGQASFDTSSTSFIDTVSQVQSFFAADDEIVRSQQDEKEEKTVDTTQLVPQQILGCKTQFVDISETVYAAEVRFLRENCIVQGYNNEFQPLRHVRYGSFLKTLVLSYQVSLQERLDKDREKEYDDVMDYGIAAVALGIIEVDVLLVADRDKQLVTQEMARQIFDTFISEHKAMTHQYRYPLAISDDYLTKERLAWHVVHLTGLGQRAHDEYDTAQERDEKNTLTPLTSVSQPSVATAGLATDRIVRPSFWDILVRVLS